MLRVIASTALVQTLHDQDHNDWIRPAEAFHAATVGGAKALGREDIGRLSPGARADIALYDTRSIAFTPLNNAVQQLTLAETGRALRHLLIDGEFVIRDGALTRIDEAAILERIHEEAAILEPEIAASEAEVTALRAPYEAIYRQCCETPIPADILPAKLPRPPP
ncbi:5-methylthioadenosine/S-adenosylhomocysteine deaminase (MTA/SAH deaminase) [Durusdinium trenchii]|uniref:5-methylthioadenosine/S-adenosylhomocysteine deaminase (MTA/SAH deaminase) n=1 Tax=Durusdinium trenchii TaxID=1381693 RepID=A0ABP0NP56_9DINO